MEFQEVVLFLGILFRVVGALTFGLMGGWFTLYVIDQQRSRWELLLGVFLGFFLFVALFARWSSAGAVGAYLFGVSVAFFLWGVLRLQDRKAKEDEEEEEKKK